MEHVWETHKECDRIACPVCEGGLSICTRCGLIEGSLTTECPGVPSWAEHGDKVYAGKEDFIAGEWVPKCSPHSPAYWTAERLGMSRTGG